MVACRPKTVMHQYRPVNSNGWLHGDTVQLDSVLVPEDGIYALSAELRILPTYPYKELWLVVEQHWDSPVFYRCDTICVSIADSLGQFLSKGRNVYSYTEPVCTLQLSREQRGLLRLWHQMTWNSIPGVSDVGLSLEAVAGGVNAQQDEQQDSESPE